MVKCSFCSRQVEPGRGLIYVAPDRVYNFCSSKCRKNNLHLGRDKNRLAWIRKSSAGKDVLKEELLQAAKEQAQEKYEQKKKPEAKPEEKKQEKSEKAPEKEEKPAEKK